MGTEKDDEKDDDELDATGDLTCDLSLALLPADLDLSSSSSLSFEDATTTTTTHVPSAFDTFLQVVLAHLTDLPKKKSSNCTIYFPVVLIPILVQQPLNCTIKRKRCSSGTFKIHQDHLHTNSDPNSFFLSVSLPEGSLSSSSAWQAKRPKLGCQCSKPQPQQAAMNNSPNAAGTIQFLFFFLFCIC